MTLNLSRIKVNASLLNDAMFQHIFNELFPRPNDIGTLSIATLMTEDFASGLHALFQQVPLKNDKSFIIKSISLAAELFVRELGPHSQHIIREEIHLSKALAWLAIPHKIPDGKGEIQLIQETLHNRWWNDLRQARNKIDTSEEPSIMDFIDYYKIQRKLALLHGVNDILQHVVSAFQSSGTEYCWAVNRIASGILMAARCEVDIPNGTPLFTAEKLLNEEPSRWRKQTIRKFGSTLGLYLSDLSLHPDTHLYS